MKIELNLVVSFVPPLHAMCSSVHKMCGPCGHLAGALISTIAWYMRNHFNAISKISLREHLLFSLVLKLTD